MLVLLCLFGPLVVCAACSDAPRQLSRPNLLATGPDGSLWVSDLQHGRAVRFSPDGDFLGSVGAPGLGGGRIYRCFGLAVSPAGEVVVVNERPNSAEERRIRPELKLFDARGRERAVFPLKKPGSTLEDAQPRGVILDADGHFLVANGDPGAVLTYDAAGKQLSAFFGPEGGEPLQSPSGLAASPRGTDDAPADLWVSEGVAHRVRRFDAAGRELASYGREGSGPGELLFPRGVAISADGWFAVADMGNHRVQRLSFDGEMLAVIEPAPLSEDRHVQLTDVRILRTKAGDERLAIVDLTGDRVLITDLDGRIIRSLRTW